MNLDIGIVTDSRPFTIEGTGIEVEKDKDGLISVWVTNHKGRMVALSDKMLMGRGEVLKIAPVELKIKAWFGS